MRLSRASFTATSSMSEYSTSVQCFAPSLRARKLTNWFRGPGRGRSIRGLLRSGLKEKCQKQKTHDLEKPHGNPRSGLTWIRLITSKECLANQQEELWTMAVRNKRKKRTAESELPAILAFKILEIHFASLADKSL